MRSTILLPLLSTTVVAFNNLELFIARRTEAISPRQTDSSALTCVNGITEALAGAPRPPPDLLDVMTSFIATATATDAAAACGFVTALPDSLTDVYSSYEEKVSVWYSTASPLISSAMEKCPAEYRTSVDPNPCSTVKAAGKPATAGATPTGSSKGTSSGSSGGDKPNAASAQTGYLAVAAAAAAGVVGVVAML